MKTIWFASKWNRRVRAAWLALLFLPASESADASDPARDARLPQRVVFGPARALAPNEQLDPSGSARSKVALPTRAKVSYQLRLAAPLIGSPAADEAGNVVVAHGVERVTELDANGKTRWSLRLGREIAGPPVVLPSGLRVIVTRDGGVFGVSSAGRVVFERALPLGFEQNAPLLAPALDGGLYVADGERLLKLGADGHPLFSLELGSALRGVFEWRGLTLAVTGRGTVLARSVAGSPTRFASLEGPVRRVALSGDRLFAIVAERALVELDLVSKRLSTRIDDPLLTAREFAVVKGRELRVLTQEAILVGTDAEGRERLRSPLDDLRGAAALGTLIVDASGASAVTLNGLDLVLVAPDGSVTSVPGTGCSDPLRPTPTGNGRLAVACRSGVLFGVKGEKG